MQRALADIGYVQTAGKAIRDLLIPAYVTAFHSVNGKISLFRCSRNIILTNVQCSASHVRCLLCVLQSSAEEAELGGKGIDSRLL
jgi:hypothetical protein